MPSLPAEEPDRPGAGRVSWGLLWRSRRVVVRDESMAPTLLPGDRLLVDGRAFRDRLPSVGDVVVLVDPEEPGRWLVKRAAAIGPGQFWAQRNGLGPRVPDGPQGPPPPGAIETVTIPPGSIYVLGDSPIPSRDSRRFGPVPAAALIGRAYRCYAPADRRRSL